MTIKDFISKYGEKALVGKIVQEGSTKAIGVVQAHYDQWGGVFSLEMRRLDHLPLHSTTLFFSSTSTGSKVIITERP